VFSALLRWALIKAIFTIVKYCHYLTQLIKEKLSSERKLAAAKIALFVQFLFWLHVLAKRYQNRLFAS